jgi:hypothetical protein
VESGSEVKAGVGVDDGADECGGWSCFCYWIED